MTKPPSYIPKLPQLISIRRAQVKTLAHTGTMHRRAVRIQLECITVLYTISMFNCEYLPTVGGLGNKI